MMLARLIASGCGLGHAPVAPGTVASAAALAAGAVAWHLSPWLLAALAAAAILGGFWALGRLRVEGDPGWVVVDELAGQWLAMLAMERASVGTLILAFALFRLLDIVKPGVIGWADRLPGPAGIMTDDILAGLIAALALWVGQQAITLLI